MLMLCCASVTVAQQIGFTYQAVALDESKAEGFGRDSKGQILLNQPLTVRFSIHEQSADGTVQYQEVHETTTDIFGIFRVVIGSGEKLIGTNLETLQWSDQAYFMQVEIDLGDGFINMGEEVIVVPPFGLNNSVQLLNLSGTQLSISEGNSVDLSNLLSTSRLSEAEVDAFVANNGYLLTEIDGSVTNEIQDLQLSNNQLTITNNPSATVIDLSPYLNNSLTEQEVDDMVANNGYLTEEIQDLTLSNNTLSITNNASATGIDLSPYQNVFETTNGVTSNENGSYASDDFVFGSAGLDQNNGSVGNNRFLFDKSKGAFRAGGTDSQAWDDINRGNYSTSFGFNNHASGAYSLAAGNSSLAYGSYSFALGQGAIAHNDFSLAFGQDAYAGGIGSIAIGYNTVTDNQTNNAVAIGYNTHVFGTSSVGIGYNNISHSYYSTVLGSGNDSWSYGETIVGLYSLPNPIASFNAFDQADRLFTIGNGASEQLRSNALIMLKNGNTRLHGQLTIDADNVTGAGEEYTLPGQDGAANQVMVTDGNGNVSWSSLSGNNVLQDLNLTNNTLTITNNPNATPIDLSGLGGVFRTTSSITSNENGNYANDDFVFGSPSLTDDGDANHASRFFFDKSSSAFRAGYSSSLAWDESLFPRGNYSVGLGYDPIATGLASIALGHGSGASGNYAIAMGNQSIAGASGSLALGTLNNVSGQESLGIGNSNVVAGTQSFAIGNSNQIPFGAQHALVLGSNSAASALYGTAIGHVASASGEESTAIGFQASASNLRSMALGYYSSSNAPEGISIGSQTSATGFRSTALGFANVSSGQDSRALGTGVESFSYGETALGLWNTPYAISQSGLLFNNTDRLLSIGNGQDANNRSDALVMLKNGNTRLHGQLTIDADNVSGAGEEYTLPGQDGAANQTLVTDGNGNVLWANAEIQDLNLSGNTLSITNNAAATNIDLSPYQNVFETTNGVTSNENGNYASDDFVFGSPQLDDNSDVTHQTRFFFDKSKGAFRSGTTTGTNWNDANVGIGSVAFGFNSLASGHYSFALGYSASATTNNSLAFGYFSRVNGAQGVAIGYNATVGYFDDAISIGTNTTAQGNNSIAIGTNSMAIDGMYNTALGYDATVDGWYSNAIGYLSSVSNTAATALGYNVEANGRSSTAIGNQTVTSAQGETAIGILNTNGGGNANVYVATDRLFTIGNGQTISGIGTIRRDALVMLKNGNTRLHGQLTIDADNVNGAGEAYTLPGQDGAANQTLVTDGNGNVLWANAEIQDLNLSGNTLSITNNAAATNIDLSPYQNVFETTNGVTSNENGDYATDDFVFGSPTLDYDGTSGSKMFFNKGKGAFRAGYGGTIDWNDANVGNYSVAFGGLTRASGSASAAFGAQSRASGAASFAAGGEFANASGSYSFAVNGMASGSNSIALGLSSSASNSQAIAIGWQASASGQNSLAFGTNASAASGIAIGSGANSAGGVAILGSSSGSNSLALGDDGISTAQDAIALNGNASGVGSVAIGGTASGLGSMTFGYGSSATAGTSTAIGWYNTASNINAMVVGNNSQASGERSIALGSSVNALSYGEIVTGIMNDNADYSPSPNSINLVDRLFVIGNGANASARSNALVMLKNGNTRLHGQLTIDADNVSGAGEEYTLPGQDGAANQTLVTDGNGAVSWQDFPVSILDRTTNIISNENGNYTTDSFVIGSPSLDDDGDANHDTRMFFEKSTGAFRVGTAEDFEWNAAERGINSVAMGSNNIARGNYSISLGLDNLAHSASSVAIGTNILAEGYNSIALGRNVATTGLHSMGLAFYSAARSFGETTMGMFATDYVPNATQTFNASDRLFTIGNGTAEAARSNALVIYKNGDATLLGTLTDASDVRLKRNIKPLQNSLLSLNGLQGVHYQWNGRKPQDTVALQTGLIAQEVEKIFPELVKTDEEGFKSVNYIGIVPHLIEAIKELKNENEQLKSANEKINRETVQRLSDMESRLAQFEALLVKSNR